jgi:pyruvate dehydrogenase E1 component subunit alpha
MPAKRASAHMLNILKLDGTATSEDPKIASEELLRAYRSMVLTRMLDEKITSLQRQGRLGTYVSCSGQEAAQIGSVMALGKKDWLFPMYRDMGMMIQMGVPLSKLANRMLGNAEDESKGRDLPNLFGWKEYRIASFAAPIACHLPLAVGFAMAAKIKNDDLVTLTSFGDGATSSGEFHVAMNFAGVYKAATIFLCENNQYAISLPVKEQTASENIAVKAKAYGFEGMLVDGNDLFAVYSAVKRGIEKARKGLGPSLIECFTYRIASHSTADDWKRYRSNEEVEHWKKRDPIDRMRLYLENVRKIWSKEKESSLRSELDSEISSAISKAESIPPPDVAGMFDDVFAKPTWNLKEQSEEALGTER